MEFKKFEKYINTIKQSEEKQRLLSKSIEQYLSSNSHCVVDICGDLTEVLTDILADYYNCWFDNQTYLSNDISWWLYEKVEKKIYEEKNGKKVKINVENIHSFWKYLEKSRKLKIKEGRYQCM